MITVDAIPTYTETPARVHPAAEQAEQHLRAWFRTNGMLTNPAAERRVLGSRFGELAAYSFPDADLDTLLLQAEWYAWWFIIDTQNTVGTTPTAWGQLMDGCEHVVRRSGHPTDTITHPLVTTLSDLCRRTRAVMDAIRFRYVGDCLMSALEGMYHETVNRSAARVPPLAEFTPLRRNSVAMHFYMHMIALALRVSPSPQLQEAPLYEDLVDAAADIAAWQNDVFALHQDTADNEPHNLVLVLQAESGLDTDTAMAQALRLIGQRVSDFHALEAALPSLAGQLNLTAADQYDLARLITGIKEWINGGLLWYERGTARYSGDRDSPNDYSAP